jgi:cobalamin-dependent methionine synthase I
MKLAKKFGAAVIALTIDEVGMAKTAEDKLRIARAWWISPAPSTACRSPT